MKGDDRQGEPGGDAGDAGARRPVLVAVDRIFADVAGVLLVLMMLGAVGSSVSRYLTGRAIPDFETLASMALVAVVFLPMAYAQATRSNVEVTIFSDGLNAVVKRWLFRFGCLIGLGSVGLLTYAMYRGAVRAHATGDIVLGVMRLETWPARAAAVVGLAALVLRLVLDLWQSRRGDQRPDASPAGYE